MESPDPALQFYIPSSALQRIRGAGAQEEEEVELRATVLNSTLFKPSSSQGRGRARKILPHEPEPQGDVMGSQVLFVKAGTHRVTDLPQPIILTFLCSKQVSSGTCVFWEEMDDGSARWSTGGCETSYNGGTFTCSCNHLSFFAVLVNPELPVSEQNAANLSYITYVGSALSVVFAVISFIIYICLHRRRPEKAISVHLHLTGALFCLHISFLLGSFWVWKLKGDQEDWVCQGLGLLLHWSLLATISWTAVEGFHLYLLLVRVFNIYVRRYLLKLSLVGWGLPTLTVLVCGISGAYGKYIPKDSSNRSSTAEICWISSQFPHRLLVSYATAVAFPCLVVLYNSCMLGLVVFKLWALRGGNSNWKNGSRENWSRLWKDCVSVLGLSCVLGLPWGLAITTYISLAGVYIFTILNSLQGVFVFLWSVALTCKPQTDSNFSSRDPSSQNMMTTSFNS
ncbi:adhesion G protein-coupled receptor G3-like [Aulostomus maculatus]